MDKRILDKIQESVCLLHGARRIILITECTDSGFRDCILQVLNLIGSAIGHLCKKDKQIMATQKGLCIFPWDTVVSDCYRCPSSCVDKWCHIKGFADLNWSRLSVYHSLKLLEQGRDNICLIDCIYARLATGFLNDAMVDLKKLHSVMSYEGSQ